MIGPIIKEKRLSIGLTQKELAEGICTDKYIYLIETKQRNPSVKMINKLSEKLKTDLFQYYQYLHFENPATVMEYKERFERHIQLSEIEKLKEAADEAAQLNVFQSEPLSYDISIINHFYTGITEKNRENSIHELIYILQNEELEIDPLTFINGHVALSSIYQIDGQFEEARKILLVACELVKDKTDYARYHISYTNVLISLIALLYHNESYDKLINYSKKLLTFQKKYNEYNRIYYAEFYLAAGYFQKNKLAESKNQFTRSLQLISLFENEIDSKVIRNTPIFSEMVKSFSIDTVDFFKFEK